MQEERGGGTVADRAVETSTACSIAKGWEVWEGEEQEEKETSKPVVVKKARKVKPSWKEQYLWKRLEESDKQMANGEKKKRAVERARMRKGAGANQPSILTNFKQVARSGSTIISTRPGKVPSVAIGPPVQTQ